MAHSDVVVRPIWNGSSLSDVNWVPNQIRDYEQNQRSVVEGYSLGDVNARALRHPLRPPG